MDTTDKNMFHVIIEDAHSKYNISQEDMKEEMNQHKKAMMLRFKELSED